MADLSCKYKNDLNRLDLKGWNVNECNLFFLILAKAKNQGTNKVNITRDEIIDYLELKKNPGRIETTMKDTLQKLNHLSFIEVIRVKDLNKIKYYSIFDTLEYEWSDDLSQMSITCQLNSNYEYMLNYFDQGGFTVFELREYLALDSFYAKQAYKLIKQYRTQGITQTYPMDQFRDLFCIPPSYQPKQITTRVLAQIEKELKPIFPGLKTEQLHQDKKQKQRTTGYRFKFKKTEPTASFDPDKYKKPTAKRTRKTAEQVPLPDYYGLDGGGKPTQASIDELQNLLHPSTQGE